MSKVGDFLHERTGYRDQLRGWLDAPIAGGPRWAYVVSNMLLLSFLLQAATGVLLMTVYSPAPQTAWPSVLYVQEQMPGGWLVRGLHYWASDAMIVLAIAHVVRLVATCQYRRPREIYYWAGIVLAVVIVALAVTGHVLPWDQKGWWSRKIESNVIGLGPGGSFLQSMLQGGPELGALGLARMHALHVAVLPAAFVALVALRRTIARRAWATAEVSERDAPFFRQLSRDIVATIGFVVVVLVLAWRAHGAPLDGPADPSSDYPARPEWFLMPFFQLRHYFKGGTEFWGTVGLPTLVVLYLVALPWIDRRHVAAPGGGRAVFWAPLAVALAVAVGLGVIAVRKDAKDEGFKKAVAKSAAHDAIAKEVARRGVPPAGPMAMLRSDPELRGRDLFEKTCASCHVLGDLGDPKKAAATKLDGWGTKEWIAAMIQAPDSDQHFGKTPYKGEMPSVTEPDEGKPPMITDKKDIEAVATFLSSEGDEPGERATPVDAALRARGEKIVKEQCTTCHLYKGDGDDEGSGEAPELSRYGSFAWTRAQVANPATDATYRAHAGEKIKGLMPRFDGDLSPADLDIVARWTRATARGVPVVPPAAP